PGGGYGTPPGPPPGGGYGTPPSGPAGPPPGGAPGSPGYGYPQAGGPGYGYPQPPAGYGYPGTGPTAPQNFGAPTAPGAAVSLEKQDGSGNEWSFSGSRGPLMVLMVGVLVSALVAGGFTVWHFTKDDGSTTAAPTENEPDDENGGGDAGEGDGDADGDSADGSGGAGGATGLPEELVQAELVMNEGPISGPEEGDGLNYTRGVWFEGDDLVRVSGQEVISWDMNTGEQNWSYAASRGNCASSLESSEGLVAMMEGLDCEILTILDITTGESVLNIDMPDGFINDGTYPAILGDHVAVATGAGGFGWLVSTGEPVWEPQSGEECSVNAYGVHDGQFIEHQKCGSSFDKGVPGHVVARAEDGEEQWRWSYEPQYDKKEFELQSLVSVEPLVVRAELKEEGADFGDREEVLLAIEDDFSGVKSRLDFSSDRHADLCRFGSPLVCPSYVVEDGLLFLAGTDTPGTVIAVELETGNALWEVGPIDDESGALRPIAAVDGKIVVYQLATYSDPGKILALDPSSESAEEIMLLSPEGNSDERDIFGMSNEADSRAIWVDNRFVLIRQTYYDHRREQSALLVYQ
ncbi:PQQ-binding-like beta-propeller repeat protein, partial [Streptomyces sp. SM14]|uniref:outer membrane protein assembly factor BamB family protein n=1 Tax=Streptomyces sp. SM14 TaxID=1736045 RepID=UPI0015E1AB41